MSHTIGLLPVPLGTPGAGDSEDGSSGRPFTDDGNPYASSAAIETAHPAASNSGLFGIVDGDGNQPVMYTSNGTSWDVTGTFLQHISAGAEGIVLDILSWTRVRTVAESVVLVGDLIQIKGSSDRGAVVVVDTPNIGTDTVTIDGTGVPYTSGSGTLADILAGLVTEINGSGEAVIAVAIDDDGDGTDDAVYIYSDTAIAFTISVSPDMSFTPRHMVAIEYDLPASYDTDSADWSGGSVRCRTEINTAGAGTCEWALSLIHDDGAIALPPRVSRMTAAQSVAPVDAVGAGFSIGGTDNFFVARTVNGSGAVTTQAAGAGTTFIHRAGYMQYRAAVLTRREMSVSCTDSIALFNQGAARSSAGNFTAAYTNAKVAFIAEFDGTAGETIIDIERMGAITI